MIKSVLVTTLIGSHLSFAANAVDDGFGTRRVGTPPARSSLRLSGAAPGHAIQAVKAEAARQKVIQFQVDPAQSFAVTDGKRTVAALVTGEGSMPGTKQNGCFVAIKQGMRPC